MTMEHVTDRLSAYIDGEMTPERRAQVEAHAAQCSACRDALAEVRSVSRLVAGLSEKALPAGFLTRLRARQARENARAPLLLPRNGLALALASVAALFVVYRGTQERVPGPASMASSASEAFDAAKQEKDLPAPVPKAPKTKDVQAARAPGAPVGESFAPEPEQAPRYTNEFLHKAVEEEQRRMGVVGVVPPDPRVRAMKRFLQQQRMEGNDIVKLASTPPPPSLQGASPEMLAPAVKSHSVSRGAAALSGGAGAPGAAAEYVSRAQLTPDGTGVLVRSQADLADLWWRVKPPAVAPLVDFSRQMLVMVLAGQGRAKLEITGAEQTQGRLLVTYKESPDSPTAAAFPFRVVDLTDLPVEFRKTP